MHTIDPNELGHVAGAITLPNETFPLPGGRPPLPGPAPSPFPWPLPGFPGIPGLPGHPWVPPFPTDEQIW